MTETAKAATELAVAPVRNMAPASVSPAMPTALALYLDDALYERVSSVASRMSKAQGVTPKHLIGAPEACFAVVSRAVTWRLDPFAVAMATYQTPGGQIGFEGKLVHAIIENSGCLDPSGGGVKYEHYGDWSKVQGRFAIKESSRTDGDGKAKKYAAATWTDDDARAGKPADQKKYPLAQSCGVRVSAHVRGEREPRILDFDLIQAQPRNSTLWATDPMTQICYTAVRRFGSVVAPSLLMGVPFDPVDNFPQPERDVTPSASGFAAINDDISSAKTTTKPAKAAVDAAFTLSGDQQGPTFADIAAKIKACETAEDCDLVADLARGLSDEAQKAEADVELRSRRKAIEGAQAAERR